VYSGHGHIEQKTPGPTKRKKRDPEKRKTNDPEQNRTNIRYQAPKTLINKDFHV
jgi:hypothetical protein